MQKRSGQKLLDQHQAWVINIKIEACAVAELYISMISKM